MSKRKVVYIPIQSHTDRGQGAVPFERYEQLA